MALLDTTRVESLDLNHSYTVVSEIPTLISQGCYPLQSASTISKVRCRLSAEDHAPLGVNTADLIRDVNYNATTSYRGIGSGRVSPIHNINHIESEGNS